MDPQRTGRDLHRYRGRIVALEVALRQARIWVEEAGAAGNEHAPRVLKRIDKALGKEQLDPTAWAVYDEGSRELVEVTTIKPENLAGVRVEPLYEITP